MTVAIVVYKGAKLVVYRMLAIKALPLFWKFLCEDYQKEGFLTINVEPKIEECIRTIEVYDEIELKPDEVCIEAKIVEE